MDMFNLLFASVLVILSTISGSQLQELDGEAELHPAVLQLIALQNHYSENVLNRHRREEDSSNEDGRTLKPPHNPLEHLILHGDQNGKSMPRLRRQAGNQPQNVNHGENPKLPPNNPLEDLILVHDKNGVSHSRVKRQYNDYESTEIDSDEDVADTGNFYGGYPYPYPVPVVVGGGFVGGYGGRGFGGRGFGGRGFGGPGFGGRGFGGRGGGFGGIGGRGIGGGHGGRG